MQDLITRLDAVLPQTQCTRCGYPRCRDYAAALAAGEAELNRCPPGGDVTIGALAAVLARAPLALDASCGAHEARTRAMIDEATCIGCRKCLDVCPVDAILGAPKLMHTVIAKECTGCALCLPPCPVDCIALMPVTVAHDAESLWPDYTREETGRWRLRTEARLARLHRKKRRRSAARGATAPAQELERARIRAEIEAAVARVRARKGNPQQKP